MAWESDSVVVVALMVAVLGFLWSLHRDMRGLSERVAKVKGLLEGLRDSIVNRAGYPRPVEVPASLPLNATGNILKTELRG